MASVADLRNGEKMLKARILYANKRNEVQRTVRCKIPQKGVRRRLLRIAKFGGSVEISVRRNNQHVMQLQTGAWPHDPNVVTLSDFRKGRELSVIVRPDGIFRTRNL
jgi:hypothetical protein